MSKIRSRNTKPEMFVRSELHKRGYRFRVNYSKIVGKPDIFFTKKQVAIFIHGCFWHRHDNCKFAYTPKSNVIFWTNKFLMNAKRDEFVYQQLKLMNIKVIVLWECDINKMMKDRTKKIEVLEKIIYYIENKDWQYIEI